MPVLPDQATGTTAPAGVRRPALEVRFGSGSAADWTASVVSLTMDVGLAPFVNGVRVVLASGTRAPAVAVGDAGTVSLAGEGGASALVFTGQVESVRRSLDGTVRIVATDGGAQLARLRLDQSYEQQNAGDIVRDLAGRLGILTDAVEDGVDLPFYVIDSRAGAYEHVARLARKSGALAHFTPEGRMKFAAYTLGQPVSFSYGADILTLDVWEAAALAGAVSVVGEGAAGSEGSDAWNWLINDPAAVTASAGSGEPGRTVSDAALRSRQAAQTAADAEAERESNMRVTGRLLVPGAPAVTVGATIETAGAPDDALNGQWMVRRVRHQLRKLRGFTTLALLSRAGGGAP